MANFSTKERLLASLLSATPRLKKLIKRLYITVNAFIYRKKYNYKILDERINEIVNPFEITQQESFWGYYDKSPINEDGKILAHCTKRNTKTKPVSVESLNIVEIDLITKSVEHIGESFSYTWQQGCRTQWLNNDLIMYNIFADYTYKAVVYSINKKEIIKYFNLPVQDAFHTDYFLSINYQRIMKLRPDYGYRNLSLPSDETMHNIREDGIWKVDYETGHSIMLHTLHNITSHEPKEIFRTCLHKVNHVMINSSGDGFIFIHRYYQGKRRFDRLMYSNFKSLKVLVDNGMVSHCCWIDNETVFGYFRYNNKNGYYYCNVQSGKITPCLTMTNLQVGDGHPSCCGNWIVFDSYPDKSRMQHLYLYNRKTDEVTPLLELYQSTKYMGECRCDLHPRFSNNGELVFFDTVYSGKRTHSYINVGKITK